MAKMPVSNSGKIEKRVWIKASPKVIYTALTDAKDLVRWFCDRASCTAQEGGEILAYWKAGKTGHWGRAIITSFVPHSLLELLWINDGQGTDCESAKHKLSYIIRPRASTTEVTVCDTNDLVLDEEAFAFLDQGWNSVLLELKDFCERRERSLKPRSHKTIVR